MALASRGRGGDHQLARAHWRDRDTSPERTKVWTEPRHRSVAAPERKVPVVYYLSRNGNLEHPHFMEVTLSSPDGLYLRDVINRLGALRGKGLASLYSWSSKRCYKNGFVWHDLTEDDFIYPAHGHEYVLKGSELLLQAAASPDAAAGCASTASSSSAASSDAKDGGRTRKEWGSFDLAEYKVPKAVATAAADASTQTDDRRGTWRRGGGGDGRGEVPNPEEDDAATMELGREDISPPPPSSSPETLETLIKVDGRLAAERGAAGGNASGMYPSGRARASAVLINLISCGAISVKEREELVVAPRCRSGSLVGGDGGGSIVARDLAAAKAAEERQLFAGVRLEDKEYFSGSLIETKKNGSDAGGEFAALKRSNSYNADRYSNLDLAAAGGGESDGTRAKCIPRKQSKLSANPKKESGGAAVARSSHGSKRITNVEVPPK